MDDLLARLAGDHPQLTFSAGTAYCWSPHNQTIVYKRRDSGDKALYSLLHELGHATLDHRRYELDFELVQLEVAAWQQAKRLAPDYAIDIDEDHVQDCLDSYRDWLYRRSICPDCTTKALQRDDQLYGCFNCHATWRVAPSRFCRPYRRTSSPVR